MLVSILDSVVSYLTSSTQLSQVAQNSPDAKYQSQHLEDDLGMTR